MQDHQLAFMELALGKQAAAVANGQLGLLGQPLARAHGAPARVIVPDLYFWKSAKWIKQIDFLPRDTQTTLDSIYARDASVVTIGISSLASDHLLVPKLMKALKKGPRGLAGLKGRMR